MHATLVTPRTPGAIAIIQIDGDVDAALVLLGIEPLGNGQRRLCDLCGVDRGVVVRWSASCAQLMPHGGPSVVSGLLGAIESRGIIVGSGDPVWSGAENDIEARALNAVARAASPAAISRLLDQPSRWSAWDRVTPTKAEVGSHSMILNRLLVPPTIVAIGRPNIGKSALVNALTGRHVALVADEPGVTRDHVGVSLRLGVGEDAVEVRWVDTPGIGDATPRDELERAALESAYGVIRGADCVALCGDADSGFVDIENISIPRGAPLIRVGLRCDLGPTPGVDVQTSALTGQGLLELAGVLRSGLFLPDSMAWKGPWRFDPGM